MKYYWLSAFLLVAACVDEIAFDAPAEGRPLVVDATLATHRDTQWIRLFSMAPIPLRKFDPVSDAQVTLVEEGGSRASFDHVHDGWYQLAGLPARLDLSKTYHLEIETSNGHRYRSSAETIRPAPEIDTLTYSFSHEEILINPTLVQRRPIFELQVTTTLPDDHHRAFLRWEVEYFHAVSEIICSPLHAPRTCYIRRAPEPDRLDLVNGNDYEPLASVQRDIFRTQVDYAFGQIASFRVTQHSLSHTAYQYWEQVAGILTAGGTIFDAPPAPLRGNIRSLTHPSEEVLGLFSLVDVRHKLLLLTRGDLPDSFDQLPFCGLPGLLRLPFNQACCDCLLLPQSTTVRPPYWP